MTSDEMRIFAESMRGIAAACNVPQYRCQVFNKLGVEEEVFAVGMDACKESFRHAGDGRCGPGGAAALLRSMAALATGAHTADFITALRHAARLTFDTDEEFNKMFPSE